MIGYVIYGRLPRNRVVAFQYCSFDTWKVYVRYMVSEVVRDCGKGESKNHIHNGEGYGRACPEII